MKTTDENANLKAENKKLKAENTKLKKTNKELEIINNWLKEQHRLAQHRKYGQSSEKTKLEEQLSFFDEAEELASIEKVEVSEEVETITYKRKKKKGNRQELLANLPTEQVIHELPLEERVCPCCAKEMHACGQKVLRKEVEVIPVQVKLVEHVQVVYSCRSCEKESADKAVPMKSSKVPAPVIKGSGVASPSLVALVLSNKYVLALPLHRQEKEYERIGLYLSRQTLANWVIYVAHRWLKPIYELMRIELLRNPILHADETTVQVLSEEGRRATQKSYMWVYLTGRYAKKSVTLFEYQASRESKHPLSFLEDFAGFLHADAYGGYRCLEAQGVVISGCLAHARRKFNDALKIIKAEQRPSSLAQTGLNYCNKLFELEEQFGKKELSLEERHQERMQHSKPVLDDFFAWLEKAQYEAPSNTTIEKAIAYALNQKQYLSKFLLDPRLELSNNRAERAIRPFTIGRKNWLFSQSTKGAEASAIIYSIIETALCNGLVPFDYLNYLFKALPNHKSDNFTEFLPWSSLVQQCCKLKASDC